MPPKGLSPTSTVGEIKAWITANRPEYAYLLANGELLDVVVGWARADAPIADLQARLKGTEYYLTHSATSRAFDQLLANDHATAEKRHAVFAGWHIHFL